MPCQGQSLLCEVHHNEEDGWELPPDDDHKVMNAINGTTCVLMNTNDGDTNSWSSTRAVVKGALGGVKILPFTHRGHTSNRKQHKPRHHHHHIISLEATTLEPLNSTTSSSKVCFFSSDAFEERLGEESLISFASDAATGIASSLYSDEIVKRESTSNNTTNNDDDASNNVIVTRRTGGGVSFHPDALFLDHCPRLSAPSVVIVEVPDVVETKKSATVNNEAIVARRRLPPVSVCHDGDAPVPPPPYQPPASTPAASKTGRMPLIPPFGTPLLPADPTNKYTKIMQKYGFTVVHHVCLTTLYQDHQRYVSALAKANPTLVPSPFPFIKELTAQQQAVAMHAAT